MDSKKRKAILEEIRSKGATFGFLACEPFDENYILWRHFFETRKGFLPWAFKACESKQINSITVLACPPQSIDDGYFPSPGELKAYRSRAIEARDGGERRAIASLKCDIAVAKEAEAGGWLPEMVGYVMRVQRLPSLQDGQALREVGNARRNLYQTLSTGLASSIRNLRWAMERRYSIDIFGNDHGLTSRQQDIAA